jgi:hypothetical protein
VLTAAAVAAMVSAPLGAQTSRDDQTEPVEVALTGLTAGFCTDFLVQPSYQQMLFTGHQPVRADQAPNLPPALKSAVVEQAEYGAWAPGRLCVYRFQRSEADARSGQTEQDGPTLAIVGLMAMAGDTPTYVANEIVTNSDSLASQLSAAHVGSGSFALTREPRRDSMPDLRLRLKLHSAQLVWEGALSRDSSMVAEPVETRWLVPARGGKQPWLTLTSRIAQPSSRRAFIGAMRVEGKRSWQKLFATSPVRYVGPMLRGGDVQLVVSSPPERRAPGSK